MGFAKLALYLIGLLVVVAAAWIFLTQTPVSDVISPGVALAVILLIVGIGVMVSANAIDDRFTRRRVTHEGGDYVAPGYVAPPAATTRTTTYHEGGTYVEPPRSGETITEERRY